MSRRVTGAFAGWIVAAVLLTQPQTLQAADTWARQQLRLGYGGQEGKRPGMVLLYCHGLDFRFSGPHRDAVFVGLRTALKRVKEQGKGEAFFALAPHMRPVRKSGDKVEAVGSHSTLHGMRLVREAVSQFSETFPGVPIVVAGHSKGAGPVLACLRDPAIKDKVSAALLINPVAWSSSIRSSLEEIKEDLGRARAKQARLHRAVKRIPFGERVLARRKAVYEPLAEQFEQLTGEYEALEKMTIFSKTLEGFDHWIAKRYLPDAVIREIGRLGRKVTSKQTTMTDDLTLTKARIAELKPRLKRAEKSFEKVRSAVRAAKRDTSAEAFERIAQEIAELEFVEDLLGRGGRLKELKRVESTPTLVILGDRDGMASSSAEDVAEKSEDTVRLLTVMGWHADHVLSADEDRRESEVSYEAIAEQLWQIVRAPDAHVPGRFELRGKRIEKAPPRKKILFSWESDWKADKEKSIKKDPIKKDPIKKDPIKKDPIKKDRKDEGTESSAVGETDRGAEPRPLVERDKTSETNGAKGFGQKLFSRFFGNY